MSTKKAPKRRFVELGVPLESWVDGFGNIQKLGGGVFRIPVYRVHKSPDGEEPDEHDIVFYALIQARNVIKMLEMLRALAAGLLDDPRHVTH